MSEQFKQHLKNIGRGLRSGRNLTQQEAFEAFSLLLAGETTAEQRGAFLMLLRVREETAQELAGFVQACRQFNQLDATALKADLDMGCYAGKRRHLPWFILACRVLAQNGKRIFLHGSEEPESHRLYLSEVLPQLGIAVAQDANQACQQLDQSGLSYMNLCHINPQLDAIIQLRAQFGLRSCANTLARMLNPSNAPNSLQGVYHHHVDQKHAEAALLSEHHNMLCFRGEGGELEFNPERNVTLHIVREGQYQQTEVPLLLAQWQVKDKALDAQQLRRYWQGEFESEYAYLAITGTLAIQLALLEQQDWSTALAEAKSLWQQRDRHWPVA
ncbi:glycosyl transferase family protein [Neptunicella sp. SCSIO 80796]|uniref:glycosyl transferase family protein n=1 Tax=Neptunicella plasticusilytica TaxID=3117012 RepID=UPI003A4DF7EE